MIIIKWTTLKTSGHSYVTYWAEAHEETSYLSIHIKTNPHGLSFLLVIFFRVKLISVVS